MWDKIKDWFHQNKSYLATLFLMSLGVGLGTACICLALPAALPVFASISLLGFIPLTFLNALPFGLAVLALSSIMVGISFAAIATGMVVIKQLTTIGINLYELSLGDGEPSEAPLEHSHDYLRRHLKVESSILRHDSDDELDELSSGEILFAPDSATSTAAMDEDECYVESRDSALSLR